MPSQTDRAGPQLSVIVPTFNESTNVRFLVEEVSKALADIEWEIIFVDDDSPDGTATAVRKLASEWFRVRCIQRVGRRGLSSACIEGMLASSAPYLAVMDGDLQHDPAILPRMLNELRNANKDLVIGSRYTEGGSAGDWTGARLAMSRLATYVGSVVVPRELKDPMSGFFMLRRTLLEEVLRNLSGLGFKILLDIIASAHRRIAWSEMPYVFRVRQAGESKLDSLVAWEYAMLIADKLVGRYVPVRFISFAAIGATGVLVHLAVLTVAFRIETLSFVYAQGFATLVSMTFNYAANNALTYRDQRRRGFRWFTGLLSFMAVCSVGAAANVGVAAYLFNRRAEWLLAAVGGVIVGAVWNYAVSSLYTWGRGNAR
jgi:dolichol-phosphate mannosyltransferase